MSSNEVRKRKHREGRDVHTEHASEQKRPIVDNLLDWYVKSQRTLPWRKPPLEYDFQRAYEVLVSESMLQQTRVETVIPYFNKWMHKFPTLDSLCQAREEDVLALWSGLGYYSRATRLLQAAKYILETHPKTLQEWKGVPGCGPYTAAAVISIAWGLPEACVDGNVDRVISRLCAIRGKVDTSSTKKLIQSVASDIILCAPRNNGGLYNQALMDLGTAICTPKKPKCDECPLKLQCSAFVESQTKKYLCLGCSVCPEEVDNGFSIAKYPQKTVKKPPRKESMIVLIYENKGKYRMKRNTERKLLAGLYDFPSFPLSPNDIGSIEAAVPKHLNFEYLGETKHLFSHIHRTSFVYLASFDGQIDEDEMWLDEATMKTVGISELARKNLSLVCEERKAKKAPKQAMKSLAKNQSSLLQWARTPIG